MTADIFGKYLVCLHLTSMKNFVLCYLWSVSQISSFFVSGDVILCWALEWTANRNSVISKTFRLHTGAVVQIKLVILLSYCCLGRKPGSIKTTTTNIYSLCSKLSWLGVASYLLYMHERMVLSNKGNTAIPIMSDYSFNLLSSFSVWLMNCFTDSDSPVFQFIKISSASFLAKHIDYEALLKSLAAFLVIVK